MELQLLQKALFNLPRSAAPDTSKTLDKLGLSQYYGTSSLIGSVEAVSPNIVFDVASLVLYGAHAVPVRLKILLDRLFSVLREEEVVQILKGYGWTQEDYQRGYILKDHRGTPLERWTMCSKDEELLVLQQFIRFGETRPIAQQLMLQEITEEQRTKAQNEVKKMIERHSSAAAAAAAAAAVAATGRGSTTSPPPSLGSHNGLLQQHSSGEQNDPMHQEQTSSSSPVRRSSPVTTSAAATSTRPPATSSPLISINGSATATSSAQATSPLNRLQNMQPYDYRTKDQGMSSPDRATMDAMVALQQRAAAAAAMERAVPPTMSPMRMPSCTMANMTNAIGLPLLPNVSASQPSSLASSFHSIQTMANKAKRETSGKGDGSCSNVLNLSRERENEQHSRKKSNNPHAMEDGIQQEMKKKLRDNIGISYVSPTTGKKRVQCNVCLKTFCDKGALKIHFSAVHLREMHKCSVDGCNMMFSSRRSRNRHSANPNPKLHTPHLRRKISPHDGRTHQGPYLPGLAALSATGHLKDVSAIPPLNSLLGGSMSSSTPFHGIPTSVLSSELQHLQRHHQMELHRLHELKMSSFYSQQHAMLGKRRQQHLDLKEDFETNADFKRARLSDSDNDEIQKNDDEKSIGDQSGKDEVSSGTHSTFGGRKRKSQNPTRITTTVQSPDEMDEEDFSSDDDDEGFENPLDDNDDELDDDDDDNDDDPQLGGAGMGSRGHSEDSSAPDNNHKEHDKDDADFNKNGKCPDRANEHDDADAKEHNNNLESSNALFEADITISDSGRSPTPPDNNLMCFGDIPLDKENPRRCVECSMEFPNHFAVKTHYQDVHLKLMHKCTIEGCNAGFPSKRSRDRHSSNLNLHRKLLSTSSSSSPSSAEKSDFPKFTQLSNSYQNDLLARFYANGSDNIVANLMKAMPAGLEPLGLFPRLNELGLGGISFNAIDLNAKISALSQSQGSRQLISEVGNKS